MKVRMGFVSNSSSSSFLIYGLMLEDDKMTEYFGKDLVGQDQDEEMEDYFERFSEEFYITYPEGYDCYYIGKSLQDCKDDQTMGEFKAEVRKLLNSKANKEIPEEEFGYHEECFYS